MKVFKIAANNFQISSNRKVLKKTLPFVAVPMVAYMLRTQKDTIEYMGEQLSKNFSPDRKMVNNLKLLEELEKKDIIEHERPWDPPRFNDNKLTDNVYEGIVAKIKASNKLNSVDKQHYLKALARANEKSDATAFKGSEDIISDSDDLTDTGTDDADNIISEISDSSDAAEIQELDKTIETINHAIENPYLLGVAAEMIPIARFIKPGVDLINGDTEKAFAGAISRGIDLAISPLKLFLASSKALCDGALGLMTGDEDFGLVKGFKNFYKDWAEARDDIENEFLGRDTKEQKIAKLRKLKQEKLEERQRLIDKKRKEKELESNRQQYKLLSDSYNSTSKTYYDYGTERQRERFRELLNLLRGLSPDSNLSQFENYYKWNARKLEANAQLLQSKISKIRRQSGKIYNPVKKENVDTEQYILEQERESFKYLLAELRYLKPNSNTSQFDNYDKWNLTKLRRNADLIRNSIYKCRQKKY